MAEAQYSLDDLIALMARLRSPEYGCPWDLDQDYKSIAPSTLEEAYEVVDAIENGEKDQLKDELGDLLFQVVFYGQLAREEQEFDFHDIVNAITSKLVRRHPHVFPDGSMASKSAIVERDQTDIKAKWEAIKKEERVQKGQRGILDDVPVTLPAVSRAQKLQKRAASVGFDWRDVNGALAKFKEEISEFEQAFERNSESQMREEIGDLFFSLINVARHLSLDAERCLRESNNKFVQRIRAVEKLLIQDDIEISSASSELLEEKWNTVKSTVKDHSE